MGIMRPTTTGRTLACESNWRYTVILKPRPSEWPAGGRKSVPRKGRSAPPSGRLVPLNRYSDGETPQDSIESVIVRRGSARRFSHESITLRDLSTVLEKATQGIPADFLGQPGAALNDTYLIGNTVDDLRSGAYVFHRDLKALELLKEGDYRRQAGHLGLDQPLPADASVDFFFMTNLNPILERFGNRGYRLAQLDASITAGKIYLAAYAQ